MQLIRNKIFWIVLIAIFLIVFSCLRNSKTTEPVDFSKVDSIAAKNDSLQLVIDRLDSILKVNRIEYEAKYDSVSNQSVDDDCDFFSEYLENLKKSSTFVNKNN